MAERSKGSREIYKEARGGKNRELKDLERMVAWGEGVQTYVENRRERF